MYIIFCNFLISFFVSDRKIAVTIGGSAYICDENFSWISSKKPEGAIVFGVFTMRSCDAVICDSPDYLKGIDACNLDPKYFKQPEKSDGSNTKSTNGSGRLTHQKGDLVWVTCVAIILMS